MKVLVSGAGGQLGESLIRRIPSQWEPIGVDRQQLELTATSTIADFVVDAAPDVVVNCAAYTNVDAAEADEQACWQVNAAAAGELARGAAAAGARMIQISTDYVFDGAADQPYPESTPVSGLGVYGRSKAAGESAVLQVTGGAAAIVRTAWLYAPGHNNFVATMLRIAQSGRPLTVVDDQVGQPTYAHDLAGRLVELIKLGVPSGIFHGTNSGLTSWFGFAREILDLWGFENPLEPVTSEQFVRPAPRPSYSVLGHDGWEQVGLPPMRDWRQALRQAHADHSEQFLNGLS